MRRPTVYLSGACSASLLAHALLVLDQLTMELLPVRPPTVTLSLGLLFIPLTLLPASILGWRWASVRRRGLPVRRRRALAAAVDAVLTLPLLVTGAYLPFSAGLPPQAETAATWGLALAAAWVLLPFVTLGLVAFGEAAGPRIYRGR